MTKVLLVYPNITTYVANIRRITPPLGLAYLAAKLEKNNIDVRILDSALERYNNIYNVHEGMCTYGLKDYELREEIYKHKPDIVGVTFPFSCQAKNSINVCRIAKQVHGTKVIVGGIHPSAFPDEILWANSCIDYVAIGEGEETLLNLANGTPLEEIPSFAYLEGQQVRINKKKRPVDDLDGLPARHLLNMEKYFEINTPHGPYTKKKRVANILTSRGCPGHCIYCSSCNFFGHKFRARPVGSILSEIRHLTDEYGIGEIQFEDDNLTYDKRRAKELFQRMDEYYDLAWCTPNGIRIDTVDEEMLALMKQSGCYQLTFGIESGSERVLHDVIKKPLDLSMVFPTVQFAKMLGMSVHLFFMLGLPTETKDEMLETIRFAELVDPDSASFSIATPLPGSVMYEQAINNNLLLDDYSFENANYRKSSMKIEGFEPQEFEKFVDRANQRFNRRLLYRHPIRYFRKYGYGKKSLRKNA